MYSSMSGEYSVFLRICKGRGNEQALVEEICAFCRRKAQTLHFRETNQAHEARMWRLIREEFGHRVEGDFNDFADDWIIQITNSMFWKGEG